MDYSLSSEKSEQERKKFFTEVKSLKLRLSSQWYVEGKEKERKEKDLKFVDWCYRLGLRFNGSEPGNGGDDGGRFKVEGIEVEKVSGKVIKVDEYNFADFDFSQIKKEVMAIDPKFP